MDALHPPPIFRAPRVGDGRSAPTPRFYGSMRVIALGLALPGFPGLPAWQGHPGPLIKPLSKKCLVSELIFQYESYFI